MMDSRPGCPLPLQVEVVAFHVAAETRKWEENVETAKYALYTINVAIPILRADWTVSRRFSDFTILRSYLASLYVAIGALPSKTLLRNLSDAHMESRRKSLNEWLNVLCGRRDVLASQTLHHFLGVDVHCKNVYARLLKAVSPLKMKAIEEDEDQLNQKLTRQFHPQLIGSHTDANFGFQDAIYLKKRGLLFTISTDFSIASKVDSIVSSTLSVLTEAAIPLSSFAIHKVKFMTAYADDREALEGSHVQGPPCTGSSEDLRWSGVCGEASFSSAPMPLETEAQLVHYFSRRATAMAVSPNEDFAVIGFESGTLAVYQHRDATKESEDLREVASNSDQDDDLSQAFHEADGRHFNRPPETRLTDKLQDSLDDSSKHESGFHRQDHNFPLLPQVAGSVRFLEIIPDVEDPSRPRLLLCGGDDKQLQFYDLIRRQPRPEIAMTFPGNPRCVCLHKNGRTFVVGFDDESIALIGLADDGTPQLLSRGSSQRTLTRQGRGEGSSSTNRVMFVSFINLPPNRTQLWRQIPASTMLDPDCESLVISGLRDGSVALWTVKMREGCLNLKLSGRISRPCVDTLQLGVSGLDDRTLVIGTKQGVVTLLCPFDGQPLLSFAAHWRSSALSNFKQGSGHSEGITSMRWISQRSGDTILLSASRDGSVNFWCWPVA